MKKVLCCINLIIGAICCAGFIAGMFHPDIPKKAIPICLGLAVWFLANSFSQSETGEDF